MRKLKNTHTMATSFYIDKRTDKRGDAPIRVRVSVRGARFLTSVPYKITPEKWDADKQQVKKGCYSGAGVSYAVINSALSRITAHFAAYENECAANDFHPSKYDLKEELSLLLGRVAVTDEAAPSFFECLERFAEEVGKSNVWTAATYQKFSTLGKHLAGYRPALTFDGLDEAGLNGFLEYLRDVRDVKNTTAGKQIGYLKWFLRWATSKGYNTNTAWQAFAPKLKTAAKQIIFLDWPELMRVYGYEIPANGTAVELRDAEGNAYTKIVEDAGAIAKARDIFCFCAFTSLRYSDAANLKRTNIAGGFIRLTTIKTADTLEIELNKWARSILSKYEGRTDLGGYVFPHLTNQRMNVYLKDLCELCGINEMVTRTYYKGSQRIEEAAPKFALIGTHAARRTFVCNSLALNIPAEVVMKWTGHSDYKSMKPYIDVTSETKAKAMSLYDKLEEA